MKHPFSVVVMLFLLVIIPLSLGCSAGKKASDNMAKEQSRLKMLANYYTSFVSQNMGRVPPNEQIFKQFVQKKLPNRQPDQQKVSLEEIFISERDQKPFVVLYGPAAQSGPRNGPAGMPVVMYEQDGVGGRRLVASSMGAVEEVDEEEFQKLVPIRK